MLAHHRAEAGDPAEAAALYLRAGERAAARSAFREARAHIARGLALLPGVADAETARRLEAGLRVGLGSVAVADKGLGSTESVAAFRRAVELCRGGLGADAPLTQALWGLWTRALQTSDLRGALRLAEEAVDVARRAGAPEPLAQSLAALGCTRHFMGDTELARSPLEEAASGEGAYRVGTGVISGGALAGPMLGRVLAGAGDLERSVALTSEAIAGARQAGHLHSLANALAGGCTNGFLVRDAGLLRGSARALAELAEAQGLPSYAMRAQAYVGWIAVEEGRVEEGTRLVLRCLRWFRETGITLLTPHYEAMLSDARLIGGDAGAALEHIEEALRISARSGEAWFDAELRRRLGGALLRLDPDDLGRAEGEFHRALGIARAQSARLFELRAARDLARLLRDRGRLAEARDLLTPVYASFTEGFNFPDLVEARALLEELGAAPAVPGAAANPAHDR